MPSVIVVGGGLAGLATAAALGSSGYDVDVFESRSFLGGRATSYPIASATGETEVIDNCQHVLLRCCVNLLDLYGRLDVARDITFYPEFYFIEPGGRISSLRAGRLPAPFHFSESFLGLSCFTLAEKIWLARALLAIRRERSSRRDLDRISMWQWLQEKRQPARVIDRFWRQILVSAINEDLERMAAVHGFQVFWLGFLARSDSYQMGIPNVPLGALYSSEAWSRWSNVRMHLRSPVDQLGSEGIVANGRHKEADYYVSALPFERLRSIAPELEAPQFEHSPITGIHLWFDRPVTDLPHATLLDRTIQWMFNKGEGRYLQIVVSASRSLTSQSRGDIIQLAVNELTEFFPLVASAQLVKAHVVKEIRATFSAEAGIESLRPTAGTAFPNIFLAGDWTRSGWPATMEGAVRSGYLAAEAVTQAAGSPQRFLLADIA
ncbi:MAG TPA: hydroxysqualene dehydroxylase HpnE [Bryobacteraceae bacterium]|nr:hydroxysqualene dehydroxylase HpnE [Bryobacteraceae bacterium]